MSGTKDGQVIDFATAQAASNREDAEEPIIPRTRAGYAAEINKTLGKTIENVIHRGLLGIGAKRDLAHGEFEGMIVSDLRCSPGYMRKNMEIAKNRFLANRSNWNDLPASVTALYELSGIAVERLAILKEGGEVHARMTIAEAVALAEAEQDDTYRPQRTRSARPAQPSEGQEGTEGGQEEGAEDGPEEDRQPDPERLLTDAEDVVEGYKIARARARHTVETIRLHGDLTTKGALANVLRELAAALTHDAEELDPPAPPTRTPRRASTRRRR